MAEIWMVRHAQSLNNALGESQRQADPDLTEIGHQQAQRLAASLAEAGNHFDRFYVSAFRRALQTAAPVADRLARSADVWIDLHEVGGCYQGTPSQPLLALPGMTSAGIRQEFAWAVPPVDWIDGGWNRLTAHESVVDAVPRVQRVIEVFRRDLAASSQRVLLVTHGEFIAMLLAKMLGQGDPFFVRPRSIYNTSITKLVLSETKCELFEFNQICHLSGAVITA